MSKALLGVAAGAAGMLIFMATCGEAGDPAIGAEVQEVACDQEFSQTIGQTTNTTYWGKVSAGTFDPSISPMPRVTLCDWEPIGAAQPACPAGFTCTGTNPSDPGTRRCTTTDAELHTDGFHVVCGGASATGGDSPAGARATHAYLIR